MNNPHVTIEQSKLKPHGKIVLTEDHNLYFGSDFHYDHDPRWKIPLWESRGFTDVRSCNANTIESVNRRVGIDDSLIILGDITLNSSKEKTYNLLNSIVCQNIYYITGNHESYMIQIEKDEELCEIYDRKITLLGSYQEFEVVDQRGKGGHYPRRRILLCHYPVASWNAMRKNSFMLHGHCHGEFHRGTEEAKEGKILDVGVETATKYNKRVNGARDVVLSFDDVTRIMSKKDYVPEGHH